MTRKVLHPPVLYPLWLRVWHLVHALLFFVLVISGLSLHYTNTFSTFLSFGNAVTSHNVAGLMFTITSVSFVFLNVRKKNIVYYRPPSSFFKAMVTQARWYLVGMFRLEPRPFPHGRRRKFNPLQLSAYLVVMYVLTPALVVSGLFLFFPELAPEKVAGAGGVWPMALIHLASAWALSMFLVSHLYMITTGRRLSSHLREITLGENADTEDVDASVGEKENVSARETKNEGAAS